MHSFRPLAVSILALVGAQVAVSCAPAPSTSARVTTAQTAPRSVPPIPARQPNILFVLVDDLGARDPGYAGSLLHETPNIDAFAKRSVNFTAAYAASPVCTPSRAAVLTGKNPASSGITNWLPGGEYENMPLIEPPLPEHLPLEEVTLAESLKAIGYITFHSGKWHLGGPGYLPTDQGFDGNVGGGHYGQPPGGWFSPYKNAHMTDGPVGEYLEDRLTNETISFIESASKSGKPFFAMMSYYNVHTPIHAAPGTSTEHFRRKAARLARSGALAETVEGIGRTKLVQDNAEYATMMSALDRNFGRLLDALERFGVSDDTIVVFTSDNGGLSTLDPAHPIYSTGTPTTNAPLRAGKGWAYEGGIRVPLLIAGPTTQSGSVEAPVLLTDLHATLLDLAGAQPVSGDGVTLRRELAGESGAATRTLFWHYPHYHGSGSKPASAVRRGDWKLIHHYEDNRYELFNLRSDPFENRNLASSDSKRLSVMKAELTKALAANQAQLPTKRTSK